MFVQLRTRGPFGGVTVKTLPQEVEECRAPLTSRLQRMGNPLGCRLEHGQQAAFTMGQSSIRKLHEADGIAPNVYGESVRLLADHLRRHPEWLLWNETTRSEVVGNRMSMQFARGEANSSMWEVSFSHGAEKLFSSASL